MLPKGTVSELSYSQGHHILCTSLRCVSQPARHCSTMSAGHTINTSSACVCTMLQLCHEDQERAALPAAQARRGLWHCRYKTGRCIVPRQWTLKWMPFWQSCRCDVLNASCNQNRLLMICCRGDRSTGLLPHSKVIDHTDAANLIHERDCGRETVLVSQPFVLHWYPQTSEGPSID